MIEEYLRSLRQALGDRLPPSVTTARLREARGHLEMAAGELGEAEAVRRYGNPRPMANEMVRVHRGYTQATAWRLVLPLLVFEVVTLSFSFIRLTSPRSHIPELISLYRFLSLLGLAYFVVRVGQTRRWLAFPVISIQILIAGIISGISILTLPNPLTDVAPWRIVVNSMCQAFWRMGVSWFAINAIVLAVTFLTERRRVRLG